MARTRVLPLNTYQPQTRQVGPFDVPTNAREYSFMFDKTNGWTNPAVTLDVMFDLSLDNGVTWNTPHPDVDPFPCGFTAAGGGTNKDGSPRTEVSFSVLIPQPGNTQRKIRANVIVAGGPLTTFAEVTIN